MKHLNLYHGNFFLMGFLIFLSLSSMIISSIIIYKKFQLNESNQIYVSFNFLNIILDFIIVFIVLFIGIHSLIYSSISKLSIYTKLLFVIILLEIVLEVFNFYNLNDVPNIKFIKNVLNLIIFLKIIFAFINIIFGIMEKNQLNQDINSCPLNNIDDFITEDLYNNILNMSKNPNDISLISEYNKLSKNSSKNEWKNSL